MRPSRWAVVALIAVAIGLAPAEAVAQCQVQVTQDIQFGTYDALATGTLDTNGNIRVTCSQFQFVVRIRINEGQSGTFSPRRMYDGTESIQYNLYRDSSFTTVWGDGSGGTQSVLSFLFFAGSRDFTVYARTPQGQDVSPGLYSDTVTVLIDF